MSFYEIFLAHCVVLDIAHIQNLQVHIVKHLHAHHVILLMGMGPGCRPPELQSSLRDVFRIIALGYY